MKQFYIVKSTAGIYSTGTPQDISAVPAGAVGFYELATPDAWKTAALAKDFAIVIGRDRGQAPIVFPEVNFKSLTVAKAAYHAAATWTASVTIPTPVANANYTLVLVKLGKHFNERTNYTVTDFIPINGSATANELAASLGNQLAAKAESENIDVTVSVSGATITVTAVNAGEPFALKAADELFGTAVTETLAAPAFGDKASIQALVNKEAAGKGFTDTYRDGDTIYPGYPETVEDVHYNVYTLRFAVPRAASKTRDEVVNQIVHIACPASVSSTLETILGVA